MARHELSPLTDKVLESLVAIACVTGKKKQSAFKADIQFVFDTANRMHAFDQNASKREAFKRELVRINKATSKLKTELDRLSDGARNLLGLSVLRRQKFGQAQSEAEHNFQIADLIEVYGGKVRGQLLLAEFTDQLECICLATLAGEHSRKRKGGAPSKSIDVPGNPRVNAADFFIYTVCGIATKYGGRLTLDTARNRGTLCDFIKVARDYLPKNLIPSSPSMSRLQRLRTQATRSMTRQKPPKKPR